MLSLPQTSLLMRWRRVQFFFLASALLVLNIQADPTVGQIYSFTLVDVNQNKFATADGRVTILVLASSADIDKARTVGDRVPDKCLANPGYRMVTVLRFEKKHHAPMRAIIHAIVRRRLEGEAARLQSRYKARNISSDARKDVFAVTDFDGAIGAQLGIPSGATSFQVLVLGRKGELLQRWNDVPSEAALADVLK